MGQYIFPVSTNFLNLSGGTVTGNTLFSANLSANTIFSGSTDLSLIFDEIISSVITGTTAVQNGINTFTGGTQQFPTVNITSATLSSIFVSGNSEFNTIHSTTISGNTIFSGSTDLSNLFATQTTTTSLQNQLNTKSNLSGATFTGQVNVGVLSATTLSASTIISGNTNLYNIFETIGTPNTQIQNGLNTYTGGTSSLPTVNVSALTINTISVSGNSNFNTLSANILSGGTIYSGTSELGSLIIAPITSQLNTKANLSGATFTGNVNVGVLSATTLSASTILSGSTDLSNLFATQTTTTSLQNQLNTKSNLSGATFTGQVNVGVLSATTLSASTILSGSTNLYNIFVNNVSAGTNINITGTVTSPIVNLNNNIFLNSISANTISGSTLLSGSTDLSNLFATQTTTTGLQNQLNTKANLSGATFTGNVNVGVLSAMTLSASTIFSGSTDLSNLFATQTTTTGLQNQLNTKANLSGATFTGNVNVGVLSATTLSASTILSGSTDLSNLFATQTTTTSLQNQLNTKSNLSGATFTGQVNVGVLSATTLSASTINSGNTNLYNIFAPLGTTTTFVQNGINTFTGGTPNLPTINITSATLSSISVSGSSTFNSLSAHTLSGGTIVSGNTDLNNIFATISQNNNKFDKTGGTVSGSVVITGNVDILGTATTFNTQIVQSESNIIFLNYSGTHLTAIGGGIEIVSGQTSGSPSLWTIDSNGNWISNTGVYSPVFSGTSAQFTSLSANTIYSGSTNLSNIFVTSAQLTAVQNGTNTFTGGTAQYPTVNITAGTFNNLTVSGASVFNTLSASTVSGGTIYSGSTNLGNLFATQTTTTSLQNQLNTKANLSGATFTGQVNVGVLSATTLSASTILSGSTDLSNLFATQTTTTSLQNQLNTKANLSGATFTGNVNVGVLSATTLSASTILSGNTNLYNIFQTQGTSVLNVNAGSNIITGGTAQSPVINLTSSPSINGLTTSGATLISSTLTVTGNTSLQSVSATTYISGSTNLYNIFSQLGSEVTSIHNGTNTYTGGTVTNPTVNVSALTINTLTTSGVTLINSTLTVTGNTLVQGLTATTLSATTLSASTMFSGSTDLSNLFATQTTTTSLQNQLNTKANLSGATFTNGVTASTFTATTISGNTLYSGSTNLSTIITNLDTRVQNGVNTFTGGTMQFPTVNITSATLSNIVISGNSALNTVSATTISGNTIYSGSTDLSNLFATQTTTNSLQNQLNTKSNLSGATFTGQVNVGVLSASTLSASTILSGNTNLYNIFVDSISGGTNINITGISTYPTINLNNNINLNSISANTIFGNTLFSGSTNLSDLFLGKLVSGGTNNRIVRWNGTTNLKDSLITIDDFGNVVPTSDNAQTVGLSSLTWSNIFLHGTIDYKNNLVITNNIFTALTINSAGDLIGNGLQIKYTGEVQTVGVGNGYYSPNPRGLGAVELQTKRGSAIQIAQGNYSVIAGGANNTSTNSYTVVGGGYENTSSAFASTVSGGLYNVASGVQSFVGGGRNNTANASNSSVLGGYHNKAFGNYSNVLGGLWNTATGHSQTVIGRYNVIQGTPSSIVNTDNAFIIGAGTSVSTRHNALSVTWQGLLQTNPITGATLPTINVSDGAIVYSANTGLYQFINNAWTPVIPGGSGGTITATNVGGTEGVFQQKIGNVLAFKSLSGGTNINLTSDFNEIAFNLNNNINLNAVSASTFYSGSTNLENIINNLISGDETFVQNGLNTYTGGTQFRPTINISGLTLDNISVTGASSFNTILSNTLSGGTIISGSTNLYNIFQTQGTSVLNVNAGSNITTGGTAQSPTINLTASPSINGLTTSGATLISSTLTVTGNTSVQGLTATTLSATTLSASTIISGSTNLYNVFAQLGGEVTSIQNGTNTYTGGTATSPTVNVSALTINTLTASGATLINSTLTVTGNTSVQGLTATTLSATTLSASTLFGTILSASTIISGSTNLYNIFQTTPTFVGNGLNTYTGGTAFNPTVNISGLTVNNINVSGNSLFNTLSANTLSGGTIYSGSSELGNLIIVPITNQINTKANLSGATFTGQINTPSLSANTLSGGTIYSGTTELSLVIQSMINSDETFVQNGTNTYTGGTTTNPSVNISAATLNNISVTGTSNFNTLFANTLSGGTIFSGSTNLYNIFAQLGGEVTSIQNGTNTYTGGTATSPTVNISALTINTLTTSGSTLINSTLTVTGNTSVQGLTATTLSATTLSANTLFGTILSASTIISGSTNLYNIFQTTPTFVGNGTNTYTGGTLFNPTVNVSALTINTISASGLSIFNSLSSTTLSGGTIYSGTSELGSLIIGPINSQLNTKANLSGATFTGQINAPSLSATTLSGGTIYSGTTELSVVIQSMINSDETFVQNGLNIYTGGTQFRPTINISAATLNNISVTGNSLFNTLSANTISGGTLYSGSSELGNLIVVPITAQLNTKANLSGATFTGTVNLASVSANTISANTISASTYFMASEQIYGHVIKSTSPINTGNTWTRSTDYAFFVYDSIRANWLSPNENRLTAVRASNSTTTQFLRVEDSQVISTTPFRVPYNATITKIVMSESSSETWQAFVTTGTTMATDYVAILGMNSNSYTAKTDYNVNINSGQTLYIGMSGTSISQPRVDVYFKQRGN